MEDKKNIIGLCPYCSNKLHQNFQKTFNKNILKIGDFIKTRFTENGKSEHMWVKIFEINEDNIKGNLDNDPYLIKNLKARDFVKVKFEDIENYLKKEKS